MFPYIYIFGKPIGVYGICMILGVFLACFLSICKGKKFGICPDDIIIVGACAFGMAIIGGVLLFAFVTYPVSTLIDMIKTGNLGPQNFGIVFYGGLIGGIFGAWIGTKIAKTRISVLIPAVVPFIPLGHAIGRVGCLMAGCCHGMEYDGFLSIHYPNSVAELPPEQGYFPVQLVESFLDLLIFGVLLWLSKRVKRNADLLFVYLTMYAIMRFGLEFLRGDAIRGIFLGLSTSQWISLGLLLAGGLGILLPKFKKENKA